jgi:hypothetical protein
MAENYEINPLNTINISLETDCFNTTFLNTSKIHGRSSNLLGCVIPISELMKPGIRLLKLDKVCHFGP